MVKEEVDNKTSSCSHENKYDKLIQEKLANNSLSKPIVNLDCFDNPFKTWSRPSLMSIAKWIFTEPNESNIPKNTDELNKELPILKPDFSVNSHLVSTDNNNNDNNNSRFKVTWIGHATLLIQVDGFNILTDPIFSQRASPSQYLGPKRYRNPACNIASLPPIDYVLISHNHYDHLDVGSVRELNNRFGSQCRWIIPSKLGSFFESLSVQNYVELDWWEKVCSHDKSNNKNNNSSHLAIYSTPNQHWSRRGLFDLNRSLWSSFIIVSRNESTFFFAGDTGYCSAFKEIGEIFGPVSGAAIPIGAYKPRFMMAPAHVDPEEALQIHQDLKSFKSIAIHHSTFNLSNEFYKEPATLLKELLKKDTNIKPFLCIKHGETVMC